MLEMLMLLGTGLVAAGVAGMTGIASQSEDVAVEAPQVEDDLSAYGMGSEFGSGEDGLLDEVRRIGVAMETANQAEVDDTPDTEVDDMEEDEAPAEVAEDETDPAEAPEAGDDMPAETGDLTEGNDAVISAVAEAVGDMNVPVAPEVPQAQNNDAPASQIATAMAASPMQSVPSETLGEDIAADFPGSPGGEVAVQPPDGTDGSEDAEDAPEVITDFMAGLEKLSLLLPEDMGADTQLRIESSGTDGEDAAVVLEDAAGSLTAAVIKGGYGTVSPDDIELQYAA